MRRFRKKPIVVEVIQNTKENLDTILKTVEGSYWYSAIPNTSVKGHLCIPTLEGVMKSNFGDYIIKGVKGEFYSCKKDIFEQLNHKVVKINNILKIEVK